MKKVGIIGAGNVGTGVGILLKRSGYPIVGVASRTPASAQRAASLLETMASLDSAEVAKRSEVVFITTNDQSIGKVAEQIAQAGGFSPGQTVIHMSGSLTSRVLQPARDCGAWAVSVHPLQSCANVQRTVANLPGSVFSIEGDKEAYPVAEEIVAALGGTFFYIDARTKPLYHAAACVASNYLVAIIDLTRQLVIRAGMPPEIGEKAFLPLINGTLNNVAQVGVPHALTGPISRGDIGTVREHLEVMDAEGLVKLASVYSALGLYTADVALRKGTISEEVKREFTELFLPFVIGSSSTGREGQG